LIGAHLYVLNPEKSALLSKVVADIVSKATNSSQQQSGN
jgi:hypothetical protein